MLSYYQHQIDEIHEQINHIKRQEQNLKTSKNFDAYSKRILRDFYTIRKRALQEKSNQYDQYIKNAKSRAAQRS